MNHEKVSKLKNGMLIIIYNEKNTDFNLLVSKKDWFEKILRVIFFKS